MFLSHLFYSIEGGTIPRLRKMGNSQSPGAAGGGALYLTASRAFSKQELEDLLSLFQSLAAQSQSDGNFISPSVFKAYFVIPSPLGDRVFEMASQNRKDGRLTFEDLIIIRATYEKGSREEIEEFIYQLCDVTGDGILSRSDMEAVSSSMLEAIFHSRDKDSGASSHNFLEAFMYGATYTKETGTEKSMSLADLRSWFSTVPSARKFLGSLLSPPDSVRLGYQVPQLQYPEGLSPDLLILRKEYAWHIGGALSQDSLDEWKLLYHSAVNGLSFTTFMGNVSAQDGPTVLIVKDTEGCIYGGYASQMWVRQSDFYGDMKSFLFQLHPKASIYRPIGANKNMQWCAVNFSSESIPNGIGFGGLVNHLGLFLSEDFDHGHTFACTTFNSPCLANTNKIIPEVIECWGVVLKGAENEKPDLVKGTVLERFKEDRNMLKMVGLANSSE